MLTELVVPMMGSVVADPSVEEEFAGNADIAIPQTDMMPD